MTDRDPFEMLARTAPFSPEPGASVEHDPAAQALFEEIIMQTPETRRPLWRRPVPIVGAAAAATVLIAGGLFTIGGDGPPSAYAQVVDATEAVADAPSGVVEVVVDLREARTDGEVAETGLLRFGYTFAGDDYTLRSEFDIAPIDADPDESGPSNALGTEYRLVDGIVYTDIGDGSGWTSMPAVDGVGDGLEDAYGFGPDAADPRLVLDLVRSASDVAEVSSVDGVTTYTGSVAATAIEALDDLPAGLAMVASEPGNLPEMVQLTVEVADDRLRSIRLDAVGRYPGSDTSEPGYVDASITTTYARMGDDIVIEAPPADQVTEQDEATTEMMAQAAIVSAYLEDHPECLEESDAGTGEAPTGDETEAADAFVADIAACFEAAGAPEVAEAWLAMNALVEEQPADDVD